MSNDNLVTLLAISAVIIAFIIVILLVAIVAIKRREKRLEEQRKNSDSEKKQVKKSEIIYSPESIIDFMDFDKIEDNMIIQKKRQIFDGSRMSRYQL